MEKKSRDRINNYNVLQNLGAGARCYVLKLLHPMRYQERDKGRGRDRYI